MQFMMLFVRLLHCLFVVHYKRSKMVYGKLEHAFCWSKPSKMVYGKSVACRRGLSAWFDNTSLGRGI